MVVDQLRLKRMMRLVSKCILGNVIDVSLRVTKKQPLDPLNRTGHAAKKIAWSTKMVYNFSMINESAPSPDNFVIVQHNHIKRHVRTLAPPPLTGRNTLVERAVRRILPWTVRNYPGVRRGMVQLLGNHVTYSAIKGWRTGRRHMSAAYVEVFAHSIRSRAERGLALAQELEQWAQHRRQEEDARREVRRRIFGAMARRQAET